MCVRVCFLYRHWSGWKHLPVVLCPEHLLEMHHTSSLSCIAMVIHCQWTGFLELYVQLLCLQAVVAINMPNNINGGVGAVREDTSISRVYSSKSTPVVRLQTTSESKDFPPWILTPRGSGDARENVFEDVESDPLNVLLTGMEPEFVDIVRSTESGFFAPRLGDVPSKFDLVAASPYTDHDHGPSTLVTVMLSVAVAMTVISAVLAIIMLRRRNRKKKLAMTSPGKDVRSPLIRMPHWCWPTHVCYRDRNHDGAARNAKLANSCALALLKGTCVAKDEMLLEQL